ncbi:MAG: hypothetical protein F9K40_01855 [Kofleriaceae bacterium]|nr:MAG: hypothetical protein F9K40_01855 [Kofleriaceae bacterium]MBZ0231559.1 hypothetical protein [Kofleriaceae bacterium]
MHHRGGLRAVVALSAVLWAGTACGSKPETPGTGSGSGTGTGTGTGTGARGDGGIDAAKGAPTFAEVVSTATAPTQIVELVKRDPGSLAWIMFLYVNWPAKAGERGVPDPGGTLGATPTVFQTWKEVHEVYLAGGAAPQPWDDGGPSGPPTLSLTEIDGTTLTDVNGNPITYTVAMNQGAFDYIVSRALYGWNGQAALRQTGAAPVAFPASAMEVKAAWKILDPVADKDRMDHYLVAQAILPPANTKVAVGLTALHITSKALPSWVWISFEQIENPTTTGADYLLPIDPAIATVNHVMQQALAGTPLAYYRANGVQTEFVAGGAPTLLANSQIETKFQKTSSCITCHALASVSTGAQPRLDFFQLKAGNLSGFVGMPPTSPFGPGPDQYSALDFVWSMREAKR